MNVELSQSCPICKYNLTLEVVNDQEFVVNCLAKYTVRGAQQAHAATSLNMHLVFVQFLEAMQALDEIKQIAYEAVHGG